MENVQPITPSPKPLPGPIPDADALRSQLDAAKLRQKAAWSAGDYAVIGTRLQIVGETLCEAVDLRAGERVLDVAAGNGNAALAAARRFCEVTAVDYVPALLEKARARAAVQGLELATVEADAEHIPLPDASFDVALSTYGVMFTPDQEAAARELVRVCRPGGRIGLASWTPEGFVGQLFKVIGGFVPPPPALRSAAQWGTEARLRELFGEATRELVTSRRHFSFRATSAAHWVELFRTYYGPVQKAFAALPPPGQAALEAELLDLIGRFDRGAGRGIVVPSEYLEAVLTLR